MMSAFSLKFKIIHLLRLRASGLTSSGAGLPKVVIIILMTLCTFCASNVAAQITQPVYLSATGNNGNDGLSPATAWLNVNALDSRTFGPGAQILFNRGDSFPGACTLVGSGSTNNPLLVGAFGSDSKPHLTGKWNNQAIFRLTTNEYIEFHDLQMSNFNTNNSAVPERQVIWVSVPARAGEINHLVFRGLDVFDVQGYGRAVHEDDHRSYAILLETAGNDAYADHFNGVLCESNTFSHIDGRGFTISDKAQSYADWRNRGTPYSPSINCIFQHNVGTNIYRNMAMTTGTDGFLLQYNTMDTTVEGSAYWPFNCANTLVQFNVFRNLFAFDADAYACHFDYNCTNTVMQYNFGCNIEGGLIEILEDSTWAGMFQENAVARYNIGVDVGWRNKDNGAAILLTGGVEGSKVYNNTIVQLSQPQYHAITFNNWGGKWPTNNIIFNTVFYAADTESTYVQPARALPEYGHGNVISNNLYFGNIVPQQGWSGGVLKAVDLRPVTGDPVFADLSFTNHPASITPEDLKVLFGSAAISNGLAMADNGGRDFFGNTVSASAVPTLGAHEYQSDATIDSDGDKMTDLWESSYGLNPGDASDALVHSDSDALINLAEFATGGDPFDGTSLGYSLSWYRDSDHMVFVNPRRKISGLVYQVETNTNLISGSWEPGGCSVRGVGTIDADFEAVTNEVPITGNQRYVRLRIE